MNIPGAPGCRRLACRGLSGVIPALLGLAHADSAWAQATAPSSITPRSLVPALPGAPPPDIPLAAPLSAPAGSEALTVKLSRIDIAGGFDDESAATNAVVARYVGRTITLGDLYEAAAAIEASYTRRGYLLVRVVVPPQRLEQDGTAKLVVIDGYLERVDTHSLPHPIRAPVAWRLKGLANVHHLALNRLEERLALASAVPGASITSTLARGETAGAAQLIINGQHKLVSGSLAIDNGLAGSLGRYGLTAQISLNSPLGLGEQFYGLAVSGYDLPRAFRADAPVRVLGGGAVFTGPDGRLSINPEATVSRTQPFAQTGVPRTRGKLARFSLRANYNVQRLRNRAITIGFAIEHVQEANDAIDFDTRLSLDRFTVGRLQANFAGILPGGIGAAIGAAFSHGLGGLDLSAGVTDPSMPGPSRQGASPRFSKATLSVRLSKAVLQGWELSLIAHGQTAFCTPLFRSEQTALEGSDALSGYVGGASAVDTGATGRMEVDHPILGTRTASALVVTTYGFVAGGIGRLERPTTLERASLTVENAGVGFRLTSPKLGLDLSVEYARGFSTDAAFDKTNRVSASLNRSF